MENKRFAGFIITYNRSHIIENTIQKVLDQTFAPEKLLIIDNGSDDKTEQIIDQLNNPIIEYYRVGYNSGPAGGSSIGLQKLAEEGYHWIYWGDDNNPPRDKTVFRRLMDCIEQLEKAQENVGLFCGKGAQLNSQTGRITSYTNAQLSKKEILEVDVIAGGQTLLVNSELVKEQILPESRLFFAFEDLDISLKVRASAFKSFVDAKTWLEIRKQYGDSAINYKPESKSFGDSKKLNREFYSTRNLLYIYKNNGYYLATVFIFFKTLIKIPMGFLKGFSYGLKNGKLQLMAIQQFISGNFKNSLKSTLD